MIIIIGHLLELAHENSITGFVLVGIFLLLSCATILSIDVSSCLDVSSESVQTGVCEVERVA